MDDRAEPAAGDPVAKKNLPEAACPECHGDGYIEEEFSPTDPDPRLTGGVRIPCPHCEGHGVAPIPSREDKP